MRKLLALLMVLTGLGFGLCFAQSGPPAFQPPKELTASDLENQMEEVGCKAERQAAAQAILQMKQQITDLQNKLSKLDPPPKSGATKH